MLQVAIIIFREFLEISLLMGVILAATKNVKNKLVYIVGGTMVGVMGAAFLAFFVRQFGDLLLDTRDEMVDAGVTLFTAVLIGFSSLWMNNVAKKIHVNITSVVGNIEQMWLNKVLLTLLVASTIFREGAEIVLYMVSFIHANKTDPGSNYLLGLALGSISGVLCGIAMYCGLLKFAGRSIFRVCFVLLAFIAAGLAVQAAGLLTSIGVITSYNHILWDTSWVVSDGSLIGQFLKVLIGYKAKPNGMQVIFYVTTLVILFGCAALQSKKKIKNS